MSFASTYRSLVLVVLLAGCESAPPTYTAPDRELGDRTPLSRACDDVDPTRCLLPWPSNAFTELDSATPTGLHLEVDLGSLNPDDDGALLSRADGFSRVSTILAGFPVEIDPATLEAGVHVYLAQHDHPERGREVPLEMRVVTEPARGTTSFVVGQPLAPMAAGADHVVVITSALRDVDGQPVEASRGTLVAMGLAAPASQAEADLAGYHAPTRAFVDEQGIAREDVVRAWDFTTRSSEDPIRRLRAMRAATIAAVDAGDVEVAIDSVEHRPDGPVATIVMGRLVGLPEFRGETGLSIDEAGMPVAVGVHDAPFRIMLPRGTGDYRVLMYGHGTGGTVEDSAFDDAIAGEGAAKVGIEFYGWTESTVIDTFVRLAAVASGSSRAAMGLVQAVADGGAIRHALGGPLGEALAADTLGGMANPHAGRHPDDSVPVWVGGSLGGTMGLVFTAAEPEVEHAVLNVPGAAWGTWVADAAQFALIQPLLARANGGALNVWIGIAAGQTFLDECDGASWVDVIADEPVTALVQESIGDPVLPNPGTHVVARVVGASQVGAVLLPVAGVETATEVHGASGLTQYHVPGTDPLEVHGFAAQDTPAAAAAQAQIFAFVSSAWAGEAAITLPEGCAGGSCDFTR